MTRGNRGNTSERRGRPTISRVKLAPATAAHIKARILSLDLEYNAAAVAEWVERLAQYDGAVWIPIDTETAAMAQRLMLFHFRECRNVEDVVKLAVRKLAEQTDD